MPTSAPAHRSAAAGADGAAASAARTKRARGRVVGAHEPRVGEVLRIARIDDGRQRRDGQPAGELFEDLFERRSHGVSRVRRDE